MKFNWHIAGYGLAAVLLVIAVGSYISAREDKIKSDAVQAAQAQYQKQLTEQMADLQKQMNDRDAAYREEVQTLRQKLNQAQTPQQIASLVSGLMGLSKPIQITTPPATKEQPNPSPIAQVSLEDAPQVKAYVSECETCKLELPKLKADYADRAKQMELAQKQIDSLKIERDVALKAAKGGSGWQRFTRTVKWLAIGGGVGYVLGHKF